MNSPRSHEVTKVHEVLRATSWLCAFVVICALAAQGECPNGKQPRTEQALIEIEQHWAAALEQHDAQTVACLLAPEFMDSGPEGDIRDRAAVLAGIANRRPGSNNLQDMKVVLADDSAVVHGINRILDAQGKEVARVRFTDTFVYRDGRWLALAGHESLIMAVEPLRKSPAATPQSGSAPNALMPGQARATATSEIKAMQNFEITTEQLKQKLASGEKFLLLDVREPWEFEKAHVDLGRVAGDGSRAEFKLVPMGDVPSRLTELDPDEPTIVMCHAGVRSLKVTVWLRQNGFENVQSLRGGITAWSRELDPKVPVY